MYQMTARTLFARGTRGLYFRIDLVHRHQLGGDLLLSLILHLNKLNNIVSLLVRERRQRHLGPGNHFQRRL